MTLQKKIEIAWPYKYLYLNATISICLAVYIFLRYTQAILIDDLPLMAFLSGEKPLIVLVVLALMPVSNIRINWPLNFRLVLYSYGAFYVWSRLQGIMRPELITENNIELMLLIAFYIFLHDRISKVDLFILILICAISGSFSIGVTLAVMIILIYSKDLKILVPAAFISIIFLMYMVSERGYGSIESVDRYQFSKNSIMDMSEYGSNFNFFFGMPVMSPIGESSCQLAYWMRDAKSGLCYSNAYNLSWARIFWDHGLISVISVPLLYYIILRTKGIGKEQSFLLLVAGILGGLSVSGIGNTFTLIVVAAFVFFRGRSGQSKYILRPPEAC